MDFDEVVGGVGLALGCALGDFLLEKTGPSGACAEEQGEEEWRKCFHRVRSII